MKSGQISGLLNINKPAGLTSHDVVARVRKLSRQRKVGHTGTLDPMATGVLLVCLGQATRLIEYLMPGRKQYRAEITFGIATDTLDADGQIVAQQDASALSAGQIQSILPTFRGEIEQYPPVFSAIKKDGQPLYKRARAGQTVEVPLRRVTIFELAWRNWQPPRLTLDVTCSAGTYIRSLARDLGDALGTGAHLSGLVRTANGGWHLEDAVSLDELWQAAGSAPDDWQQYLQPLDRAVAHLPRLLLTGPQADDVTHGRQISVDPASIEWIDSEAEMAAKSVLRAYSPDRRFLAILARVEDETGVWRPKKVFHPG